MNLFGRGISDRCGRAKVFVGCASGETCKDLLNGFCYCWNPMFAGCVEAHGWNYLDVGVGNCYGWAWVSVYHKWFLKVPISKNNFLNFYN